MPRTRQKTITFQEVELRDLDGLTVSRQDGELVVSVRYCVRSDGGEDGVRSILVVPATDELDQLKAWIRRNALAAANVKEGI